MNKFVYWAGVALLTAIGPQAQANIDTGAPSGAGGLLLNSGEWLAAEFTLTNPSSIQSLEGYIRTGNDPSQIGNSFTVTVYDDLAGATKAQDTPDMNSIEFSGSAIYTADGWNGIGNIRNLLLNPGDYWLAFEVGAADSLQALMPTGVAKPLPTAWYDGVSTFGYTPTAGAGYDFGVQIGLVPLPSTLLLAVPGLLALSRIKKRRAA